MFLFIFGSFVNMLGIEKEKKKNEKENALHEVCSKLHLGVHQG